MKIIKQAHLRDVLNALEKEEITFSRATELLNEIASQQVHQALDEAAEKAELLQEKISPGYYNQGDIKECDFNDGLHDAIGVVLSLKEKY